MDPVADLNATLTVLSREQPGALVAAMASLHAALAHEIAVSAEHLQQIEDLELLLSELRDGIEDPDADAKCSRALSTLAGLRISGRRLRRKRMSTLLTANAQAAQALPGSPVDPQDQAD